MDHDEIRAFAGRNWSQVQAAKERHWADLARVRGLLGLLQQALSRSDLTPEFERLLAAAQR